MVVGVVGGSGVVGIAGVIFCLTHSHSLFDSLTHSLYSLFRTSAQEQGIPEGFTRTCDTPNGSPPSAILGFKASLYNDQCWKKMPEKDTDGGIAEDGAAEEGAKVSYVSVGVVLVMVGSAVLLHL